MENSDIKYEKALMILLIFIVTISIFQMSRLGILKNIRNTVNKGHETSETFGVISDPKIKKLVPSVAIITDRDNPYNLSIMTGIKQYIEHMGFSINYVEKEEDLNLSPYDMVIVTLNDFDEGYFLNTIMEFVGEGKSAYFPYLPFDKDIYSANLRALGVIERVYEFYNTSEIEDKTGVLGTVGEIYTIPRGVDGKTKVRLSSKAEVLMTTEQTPVFWSIGYGKGKFFVGNLDFLAGSESRGILSYALYEGIFAREGKSMIQPFYGITTTVIMDLPIPLYVHKSEMLSELGVDQDTFTLVYFYKKFIDISEEYGDKISLSYTVDYTEIFNKEFPETLKKSQFMLYAAETIDTGGELITGGYTNHPLGEKNELEEIGYFVPWKNQSQMKESFTVSRSYVNDFFKNYRIASYIPPHGRIGEGPLSNISKLSPGIETIINRYKVEYSDQLLGDFRMINDGKQYLYTLTSENGAAYWGAVNSINSLGITSYGFHSFQMLTEDMTYENFENDIEKSYEWQNVYGLKKMTPREATGSLKQYQKMDFRFEETQEGIQFEIDHMVKNSSFMLRTKNTPISGDARIEKIGNQYIVFPYSAKGIIWWEELQ